MTTPAEHSREKFEWEREHSPFTIEGQIESYGMFARGLARRPRVRSTISRFFLISAITLGVMALIGLITALAG